MVSRLGAFQEWQKAPCGKPVAAFSIPGKNTSVRFFTETLATIWHDVKQDGSLGLSDSYTRADMSQIEAAFDDPTAPLGLKRARDGMALRA